MPLTRKARRASLSVVASATSILLMPMLLAACSNDAWYVSRHPALRVDIAGGCPRSVVGYADVVNTYGGSRLVPPGPTGGIICSYHPRIGPVSTEAGHLAQQIRLDGVEATHVAEAVRSLDLRTPTGKSSCPEDIGAVEIIGLSYSDGRDVGLWYATSGCQSLDNGRLGSAEGGNPSFYMTFEGVINNPSSPPKPAAAPATTPPVTIMLRPGQSPIGQPATTTTTVR